MTPCNEAVTVEKTTLPLNLFWNYLLCRWYLSSMEWRWHSRFISLLCGLNTCR